MPPSLNPAIPAVAGVCSVALTSTGPEVTVSKYFGSTGFTMEWAIPATPCHTVEDKKQGNIIKVHVGSVASVGDLHKSMVDRRGPTSDCVVAAYFPTSVLTRMHFDIRPFYPSPCLTMRPAMVYMVESYINGVGSMVPSGTISMSLAIVSVLACSEKKNSGT